MNARWVALAAALTLAAVAAPVQAADGTMTGRAHLPLQVSGIHEASGPDARFLLEGNAGQASLLVQGIDGTATRIIHRAWGYVNTEDPLNLDVVWDDEVDRIELPLDDALLSLDERREGFAVLAWAGDVRMSSGAYGSPLLVGALAEPKTIDYQLDRVLSLRLNPPDPSDEFRQVIPTGSFESRSDDGRVRAVGAFRLFVTDATLTYRTPEGLESIPAHFRVEQVPGQIYNPLTGEWTGDGSHTEYVQEYLVVEATEGRLEMQFAGLSASIYAERANIAVDGVALLPKMEGTVTIVEDGKPTRHVLRGDDLELGGRFTLRTHDVLASPARTQVEGEGDITTVTFAGTSAKYDWAQAAAAAGLGALALAALAWAAANAKTLLGSIGGLVAGYARVSGQEILEHPGRQEVYERVKAFPGVSFVQLAQQVSFGASTLTYHLRVLEKNQYVASVKDGRYIRFFDRQAGTYSGERKHAVSALRNTTTAAIARHILDNPGVAQCELAEKFEVTASTVTWHINRLTAAELVQRQRDAHFTRYYVGEGWSRLPLEEQARMAEPMPQAVAALAV